MRGRAKTFVALGAAFVLGAGAANAEESKAGAPQTGRSAAREQAGGEARAQEISGRVITASPTKLYLEHMGAVVEFNLRDTEFSGGDVRSSRDLSEGQQVRASFTVENKTINVAKRVSLVGKAGTKPYR